MALGIVAGGLGTFLFDPVVGAGRRARLAQRAKAVLNDLQRTITARSRDLRNRTLGTATELGLPGTPQRNAERRESAPSTAAAARYEVRTPPRSAAASAVRREDARDRVPVAAGTEER